MRLEAKHPLLVGTVLLVFVSIFTKSQALSPFEALNSAHLSKCQRDLRISVQKRLRTIAFSRVSTRDSDIASSCEMKDEPAFMHCRESQPSFESEHLGVHSIWGRKQESLSPTYFCGKAPLEVLVENWLTSSVEDRESFSSIDDIWCTEVSSSCSTEIDDPLYLRGFSLGIYRVS